jgi:hypothetical protein
LASYTAAENKMSFWQVRLLCIASLRINDSWHYSIRHFHAFHFQTTTRSNFPCLSLLRSNHRLVCLVLDKHRLDVSKQSQQFHLRRLFFVTLFDHHVSFGLVLGT